jgi:AraC-like DNA-binding protein
VGLRVTQGWGIELFGVLGYLIYTSETMGAAVGRIIEFKELWSDGEEMWLERSGETASLFWRALGPERLATRVLADMALADIVLGSGELMGRALPLVGVRVPYDEPEDVGVYEEVVGGAPVGFGAPWLCVTVEAQALDWPVPSGDEMLHAYFAEQARARQRLRSAPRVSERVRAYLWVEVVGGAPSLADVARVMGVSTRTLQRSLRADGETFAGLLDQVRHALALEHLASEVSVAELSWLLGFSEPRALHRAFKRWTGTTPAAVRARLAAAR